MLDIKIAAILRNSILFLVVVGGLCSTARCEEPLCKQKGAVIKVAYPDLARKMKISGIVRLHVVLTPSGGVRETKVLGGNPVLASSAQDAVKQAKFEGSEPCVMVFEFRDIKN